MELGKEKLFQELDFQQIRDRLAERCHLPGARNRAENLAPLRNREQWKSELHCVNELLLWRNMGFNIPDFPSREISDALRLLGIENSTWAAQDFLTLAGIIRFIRDIKQVLHDKQQRFPHLHQVFQPLEVLQDLLDRIEEVFDKEGEVKSAASAELRKIRKSMAEKKKESQYLFDQVMRKYRKAGYLSDMQESHMHGRRVLSVLSEHKRQVPGHTLGTSSTGQLTYIEPETTVGPNNELNMLENEEVAEINRILNALTHRIRPERQAISVQQGKIVWLDLALSKASLARDMDALLPQAENKPMMDLKKAYHPLLLLKNSKTGAITVPHDIRLDTEQRIIVISGPNAGGKSIAMKTAGLIQVMYQCGMLVPVDRESRMGIFRNIFTDIGDNQSIDNELSTFSYRLSLMKTILERSGRKDLVLIDEFGTGTDPELGAALAETFFEELYQTGCKGIITTHYSNIKEKAGSLPASINACMLFDREKLVPQYQMKIGTPGRSYTFEVARNIGFGQALIERAKKKVASERIRLDQTLADVQENQDKMQDLRKRMLRMEDQAKEAKEAFEIRNEHLDRQYTMLTESLERNKQHITWGKMMEKWLLGYPVTADTGGYRDKFWKDFVREWKKWSRQDKKTTAHPNLKKQVEKTRKKKEYDTMYPVKVGGKARIIGSSSTGEVQEIKDGKAIVLFGQLRSIVDLKKLEGVPV